jgi:hypothetical protein
MIYTHTSSNPEIQNPTLVIQLRRCQEISRSIWIAVRHRSLDTSTASEQVVTNHLTAVSLYSYYALLTIEKEHEKLKSHNVNIEYVVQPRSPPP